MDDSFRGLCLGAVPNGEFIMEAFGVENFGGGDPKPVINSSFCEEVLNGKPSCFLGTVFFGTVPNGEKPSLPGTPADSCGEDPKLLGEPRVLFFVRLTFFGGDSLKSGSLSGSDDFFGGVEIVEKFAILGFGSEALDLLLPVRGAIFGCGDRSPKLIDGEGWLSTFDPVEDAEGDSDDSFFCVSLSSFAPSIEILMVLLTCAFSSPCFSRRFATCKLKLSSFVRFESLSFPFDPDTSSISSASSTILLMAATQLPTTKVAPIPLARPGDKPSCFSSNCNFSVSASDEGS
mmetsp:Transcript_21722/g.51756  ORF Transcript_21722/g.51756 Transcript_21722/m.51756 type:complete len:289 (-) Transcript_21722:1482-2348(-)